MTGVEGRSHTEWRTESVCSHRGLFTIGPTRLTTGDPFGIFTLQIQDPASRLVIVVPPIVPLPAIEVAPGGRSGSGRPRQNAPERTVSASTVRQYVPGDNLHTIHWKTTARRDSPLCTSSMAPPPVTGALFSTSIKRCKLVKPGFD